MSGRSSLIGSPRGRRPASRRPRVPALAVAAVVLLVTTGVTVYAFSKSLPFSHSFTAYAVVSDSVNVRGGDPVRIAGIDVGQVRSVSPAGNATRIKLTLERSAMPVHRDATIRIRDRLFLEGSYYLELDRGTPAAPALRDGGTIPESQTSSPVQAYRLLSTFTAPVRTSLVNLVNALGEGFGARPGASPQSSGAAALKRAAPELAPLFSDTAIVARSFQGTAPGDVGNLLSSTAKVTGTLAQSSRQLAGLVRGLSVTSGALASSDRALARTVVGFDQTLRAAPATLSAIDSALPPVRSLSHALAPSLRATPPLVDRVTATARQLAGVLAPGQRGPLIRSLRATFQQLPAILTQFARTFPIGKQITDCLRTHLLPVLKETVPDGSLSTGRPVWQDFIHFLPNVGGATGSFDANGPYTRVLLGAGTNSVSAGFDPGQLLSTAPPGGSSVQGARPEWVGDLTPSDFRPDAPCAAQPLPSLDAGTGAPDLSPRRTR